MMTDHALLTAQDVADRWQVPQRTVMDLYRAGRLGGTRIGKHVRFTPEDLATFVAAQHREPKETALVWSLETEPRVNIDAIQVHTRKGKTA